MKTLTRIVVVLIGLFFVAAPGSARAMSAAEMMKKFGLSAAQASKVRTFYLDQHRKAIMLKAKKKLAGLDLHIALSKRKPNLQAVEKAVEKVAAVDLQLKKLHVLTLVRIKLMLSPAQLRKVEAHEKAKKERKRREREAFRRWRARRR